MDLCVAVFYFYTLLSSLKELNSESFIQLVVLLVVYQYNYRFQCCFMGG